MATITAEACVYVINEIVVCDPLTHKTYELDKTYELEIPDHMTGDEAEMLIQDMVSNDSELPDNLKLPVIEFNHRKAEYAKFTAGSY